MRSFLTLLLTLFCLNVQPAEARKLRVVSTFSILGDFVRQIAGDEVTLTTLVGPDGDAHAYEPTPEDAKTLADADLIIANGLDFETWLDRLIASSGFKGLRLTASDRVTPRRFANGETDPHAWQDVANGIAYVAAIDAGLENVDPLHAVQYRLRTAAYTHKLRSLDGWVRGRMMQLAANKRRAITSHDAFGYFAATYGVTFIAPLGGSTTADANAGAIAGIIDQMKHEHIRAVFLENMSDPRLVEQLARDGGAAIGGTLYSDALSAASGLAPIIFPCSAITS